MKRLVLAAPLIILSLSSYAQKTTPAAGKPMARAENMQKTDASPVVTIGTIESTLTSREKVLAYPRLLAQELNCEITGYTFTISGTKSWGPVDIKGAVFTDDVKDKIKEMDAPPKVKITIDNIHIKCNGGPEMTARPITVEYDH